MMRGLVFLLFTTAGLTGCSDGKPGTYAVTLPVRVNAEVPVGANVTLHPLNAEWANQHPHRPFGKVVEDGTVRFSTFAANDGVPAGDYIVTLSWPLGDSKDRDALQGEHQDPARPNPRTITVTKSETLHELVLTTRQPIRKQGGHR